MPETIEKRPKTTNPKQAILIVVLMIIGLLVAGYVVAQAMQPKSQYAIDREALEGFLPSKTQEEIEAELGRIIDASRFNVSINPTPVIEEGKINVMVENIPANHYWMQVDVTIQNPDGGETLVYRSGLIQQGYYIENAQVETTPAPGQYNARAVFRAIKPESLEEIGETEATMVVLVGDAQ